MIHVVDRRIEFLDILSTDDYNCLIKRSEVRSISLYSNIYLIQVVFVNVIIESVLMYL